MEGTAKGKKAMAGSIIHINVYMRDENHDACNKMEAILCT